jgi:L,D-peptidoglycan transpeptidase YkuD (ErfK/YbiS/YcfS/YnhG family)
MGVFDLGTAFRDGPLPSPGQSWPQRRVTENDLWIEDAKAATYNQHIVVPEDRPRTPWEESQRMRMGDPAHRLKIVIHHNTSDIRPGGGSAIFFHIWRSGGAKPTSGCTAMAEQSLEEVLGWLSPDAAPVYALLDAPRYAAAQQAGALP